MRRSVLAIPLEEVGQHLELNARKDVKIVAPALLTDELSGLLTAWGKQVKREHSFKGAWKHSGRNEPNLVCASSEFGMASAQGSTTPFALSFASEHAEQDEHYHKGHLEIYFSTHAIGAEFRDIDQAQPESIYLEHGGVIVFGPRVTHRMHLTGLTLVIEIPAVSDDKFSETVVPG